MANRKTDHGSPATGRSLLVGNGFNINFGGQVYSNDYIIKRIIFNALANKYDPLFNGEITGEQIAYIFTRLSTWVNDITDGKYDDLIDDEEKPILEDFKARYNWKQKYYYEVGLEDWLFVLHVAFLEHSNISNHWQAAKQAFEKMMLDAIYNDGDIQNLYKRMGKPVKRWLQGYDKIFTLNYDNNIEDLSIGRPVFHLHGDFRTLANSEDPKTIWGFIRHQKKNNIEIPEDFKHCFCNAILDYTGGHKYEIAYAFEQAEKGLIDLERGEIPPEFFPVSIEDWIGICGGVIALDFNIRSSQLVDTVLSRNVADDPNDPVSLILHIAEIVGDKKAGLGLQGAFRRRRGRYGDGGRDKNGTKQDEAKNSFFHNIHSFMKYR